MMATTIHGYSAYKDSGVDWLGEVPVHWDVRRAKQLFLRIVGESTPSSNEQKYWDGPHVWVTPADVSKVTRIYNSQRRLTQEGLDNCSSELLPSGSIAVTTRVPVGNVALARVPFCTNQGCKALIPREVAIDSSFPFNLVGVLQSELRSLANGATFTEISTGKIGDVQLPVPPLLEQVAITRFLDHAIDRIEHYVHTNEKLIALLEEQKQVLVHDAVTGQIDVRTGKPYSEYKESGVGWLGNVPTHWEIARNGRLFVQRNETGFPELPILGVSLRTGVCVRSFKDSDCKPIMLDYSMYKRSVRGDIAFSMMRMCQRSIGVTPVEGVVSPAYVFARRLAAFEPRYFDAFVRTRAYMDEVNEYSRGIVKDRSRLHLEYFNQIPSPRPVPGQQVLVAKTVYYIMAIIDDGSHSIGWQMDLLREYQVRLITDVVTDTLDGREAAVALLKIDSLAADDKMGGGPDAGGKPGFANEEAPVEVVG